MNLDNPCPCSSGKRYDQCCEPYVSQTQAAPTAEALMRSRYVAYALGIDQYVLDTWHPSTRPAEFSSHDKQTDWLELHILRCENGLQHDDRGVVEFRARCRINGEAGGIDEKSQFVKENGRWYYVDGSAISPIKTRHTKVGRNDPCPCGSGKKYKKCCV